MKIYYLNTYDPEARFNLSGENAQAFFKKLRAGMEKRGYQVEETCEIYTVYDDLQIMEDEMETLKELGSA